MAFTVFDHMPPRGEYKCRRYNSHRFFCEGPDATLLRYLNPGENWPPSEYNFVDVGWVRLNSLERVGEHP